MRAPRILALLREGLAQARRDRRFSVGIGLVVALVVGVVLATTGRTAATEQSVVSSIDSLGARVVVLTDSDRRAAIEPSSVAAIQELRGVEWAFGIGPAQSGTSGSSHASQQVSTRALYGELPDSISISRGRHATAPGEAVAGTQALQSLGLSDGAGPIVVDGRTMGIVGSLTSTGRLGFLNDSVLYRAAPTDAPYAVQIYLAVDNPADAQRVADSALAITNSRSPDRITVEVSSTVIQLGDVVSGKLGASARQLMALVLMVGLSITGVVTLAMVSSQRRNFGRLRALGASRSALTTMVLVRTAGAAFPGAIVGCLVGSAVVSATTEGSVPHVSFVLGVGLQAVLMALLGAMIPALVAARADPVAILRVP